MIVVVLPYFDISFGVNRIAHRLHGNTQRHACTTILMQSTYLLDLCRLGKKAHQINSIKQRL